MILPAVVCAALARIASSAACALEHTQDVENWQSNLQSRITVAVDQTKSTCRTQHVQGCAPCTNRLGLPPAQPSTASGHDDMLATTIPLPAWEDCRRGGATDRSVSLKQRVCADAGIGERGCK